MRPHLYANPAPARQQHLGVDGAGVQGVGELARGEGRNRASGCWSGALGCDPAQLRPLCSQPLQRHRLSEGPPSFTSCTEAPTWPSHHRAAGGRQPARERERKYLVAQLAGAVGTVCAARGGGGARPPLEWARRAQGGSAHVPAACQSACPRCLCRRPAQPDAPAAPLHSTPPGPQCQPPPAYLKPRSCCRLLRSRLDAAEMLLVVMTWCWTYGGKRPGARGPDRAR
jgi:hypothetical protein